eukprot:scaffold23627_cov60-Phaeocystis_antarctica.AAC.7
MATGTTSFECAEQPRFEGAPGRRAVGGKMTSAEARGSKLRHHTQAPLSTGCAASADSSRPWSDWFLGVRRRAATGTASLHASSPTLEARCIGTSCPHSTLAGRTGR